MHLQLEVSSLWAFLVLYWLLLSCRHFKDLAVGTWFVHPSSQNHPGTEALFVCSPWAGVTAQAQRGFPKALWGLSEASQVCVGCVSVGLPCPGLPKPGLFACPGVVLGASSRLRRRDPNRPRGTGCQRQSSLILSGCNYSLALGSERFLCVPRTHILRRG